MSLPLRLCSVALAASLLLSLSAVAEAAPGGSGKAAAQKCRSAKSHKRSVKCKTKSKKKHKTKHRASAAVASFEAESMTRSGSYVSVAGDSTASGGKVMRFLGNGSASITQNLTAGDGLTIRARG